MTGSAPSSEESEDPAGPEDAAESEDPAGPEDAALPEASVSPAAANRASAAPARRNSLDPSGEKTAGAFGSVPVSPLAAASPEAVPSSAAVPLPFLAAGTDAAPAGVSAGRS
ncbi:hypothetical protein SGRIM128S_08268 [Streptomyces griseomycini]